ncbi:MAG: DUF4349 domain-containing protein [Candidatus Magasanikbacteria bacterium]|nr:DUF4349 domain-containing protein [Candidatus Magasanikbacteria bacterium]
MNRRTLIIGGIVLFIALIAVYKTTNSPPMMRLGDMAAVSMNAQMPVAAGEMARGTSFGINNAIMPEDVAMGRDMIISPYPPAPDGAGISDVDNRLIIKTGSFSIVASNVSEAASQITRFVEEKKGIVVSNQVYDMDTRPSASVVVRVPVQVFNEVISQIKGVGEVRSESINGQDVTEEFVDLEAQLHNFRATETQFLEIMKRATQIQDILAVQRELMNVRSSIESIEGRIKYLSESADYSTITVYLSSDSSSLPILDDSSEWKLVGEIKEAMRSLVEFGKEFVSIVIRVVIFAPVWGVIALVAWLIVRRLKRQS